MIGNADNGHVQGDLPWPQWLNYWTTYRYIIYLPFTLRCPLLGRRCIYGSASCFLRLRLSRGKTVLLSTKTDYHSKKPHFLVWTTWLSLRPVFLLVYRKELFRHPNRRDKGGTDTPRRASGRSRFLAKIHSGTILKLHDDE